MDRKNNKPTRKDAILTQCWECLGFYADGKQDCENPRCPLYSYMPFAKMEPILDKFAFNPLFKGKKLKEDTRRPQTEEQRKESALRLKNAIQRSKE